MATHRGAMPKKTRPIGQEALNKPTRRPRHGIVVAKTRSADGTGTSFTVLSSGRLQCPVRAVGSSPFWRSDDIGTIAIGREVEFDATGANYSTQLPHRNNDVPSKALRRRTYKSPDLYKLLEQLAAKSPGEVWPADRMSSSGHHIPAGTNCPSLLCVRGTVVKVYEEADGRWGRHRVDVDLAGRRLSKLLVTCDSRPPKASQVEGFILLGIARPSASSTAQQGSSSAAADPGVAADPGALEDRSDSDVREPRGRDDADDRSESDGPVAEDAHDGPGVGDEGGDPEYDEEGDADATEDDGSDGWDSPVARVDPAPAAEEVRARPEDWLAGPGASDESADPAPAAEEQCDRPPDDGAGSNAGEEHAVPAPAAQDDDQLSGADKECADKECAGPACAAEEDVGAGSNASEKPAGSAPDGGEDGGAAEEEQNNNTENGDEDDGAGSIASEHSGSMPAEDEDDGAAEDGAVTPAQAGGDERSRLEAPEDCEVVVIGWVPGPSTSASEVCIGKIRVTCPERGFSMANCRDSGYDQDVYVHMSVAHPDCLAVNDVVAFTIHVNSRGQPQASDPLWKLSGWAPSSWQMKFAEHMGQITRTTKSGCGWVESAALNALHGQEVFVHTSVMQQCRLAAGDVIAFDVHTNAKGKLQVSAPCWKAGTALAAERASRLDVGGKTGGTASRSSWMAIGSASQTSSGWGSAQSWSEPRYGRGGKGVDADWWAADAAWSVSSYMPAPPWAHKGKGKGKARSAQPALGWHANEYEWHGADAGDWEWHDARQQSGSGLRNNDMSLEQMILPPQGFEVGWVVKYNHAQGCTVVSCKDKWGEVIVNVLADVAAPQLLKPDDIVVFRIGSNVWGAPTATAPVWKLLGGIPAKRVRFGKYMGHVDHVMHNSGASVKCRAIRDEYGQQVQVDLQAMKLCRLAVGDVVSFNVSFSSSGVPMLVAPCWKCCSDQGQ